MTNEHEAVMNLIDFEEERREIFDSRKQSQNISRAFETNGEINRWDDKNLSHDLLKYFSVNEIKIASE
jgi:hypothetical protein